METLESKEHSGEVASGMLLTATEVTALTGKKNHSAQARALNFMKIDFKLRPDGSVAVLRSQVEKAFGYGTASIAKSRKEPDFSMMPRCQ